MGSGCKGAPAAGSWGENHQALMCSGSDGKMKMKQWDGTQWVPSGSNWDDMGGSFVDDGA